MAAKTPAACRAPMMYVDQPPAVSEHNGMLVCRVTTGGAEQQFIMTCHAALAFMQALQSTACEVMDRHRRVTAFPGGEATSRRAMGNR